MNQDSRRKLKQVYHLFQFIEPLLKDVQAQRGAVTLADHGAGKSYLGFILYDLFFGTARGAAARLAHLRHRNPRRAGEIVGRTGPAPGLWRHVLPEPVGGRIHHLRQTAPSIDVVTALHACNTATDDAIRFALEKKARYIVVVPCCQAEVASVLRKNKAKALADPLAEIWRHPLHAGVREPDHQCAALLAAGSARVSGQRDRAGRLGALDEERVDHRAVQGSAEKKPAERLREMLERIGLQELKERFSWLRGEAGGL